VNLVSVNRLFFAATRGLAPFSLGSSEGPNSLYEQIEHTGLFDFGIKDV
jgi:hypothetical protein